MRGQEAWPRVRPGGPTHMTECRGYQAARRVQARATRTTRPTTVRPCPSSVSLCAAADPTLPVACSLPRACAYTGVRDGTSTPGSPAPRLGPAGKLGYSPKGGRGSPQASGALQLGVAYAVVDRISWASTRMEPPEAGAFVCHTHTHSNGAS